MRIIQKELKFSHDGVEYVVVARFTEMKLEQARKKAVYHNGAVLNSATVYDMTAWRNKHK